MEAEEWPSEWLRGALSLCVLRLLLEGPSYGYALTQKLAEAGLGTVKGGTLYPLLARLEDGGLVDVDWRPGEGGPGRKFYALTPAGRAAAHTEASRWLRFAGAMQGLLTETETPKGES